METGPTIEDKIEVTLTAENEADMKKLKDDMRFILASFERRVAMNHTHRRVKVVMK